MNKDITKRLPISGLRTPSKRDLSPQVPWWEQAIFYEIAPISFQDSNGDGKGDLGGLLQRLDYLGGLWVNVVWLTPIYVSPMLDFGYDIADFCAIDPTVGRLQEF